MCVHSAGNTPLGASMQVFNEILHLTGKAFLEGQVDYDVLCLS